jgi:chromosome segregation and condensation protein ScpB
MAITNGLPLSSRQYQVLCIIEASPTSTADIDAAIGSRSDSILKSLHQQCSIAYVGGRGTRQRKGKWRVTDHGRRQIATALALALEVASHA